MPMRYTIRRISFASAARLGCALGWLAALLPALVLAWLAVEVLQPLDRAFESVKPISIGLLGREIARIDVLEVLRLQAAAQTVDRLAGSQSTFSLLALGLVLAGGLLFFAASLLLSLAYNLLARAGWGLEVELSKFAEEIDS